MVSLKSRNGFSAEKSALLTLRYLLDAEAASHGGKRVTVDYADLLKDWQGTLKSAWTQLGLAWPADTVALDAEMDRFVHKELRHQAAVDGLPRGTLGKLCQAVHKAWRSAADGADPAPTMDAARSELTALSAGYDRALGTLYSEVRAQRRTLGEKEQEIKHVVEERGMHAGLALARAQELEWQRGELQQYARLQQAYGLLQGEIQALYHSTSWRISAPVRGLAVLLRSSPEGAFPERGDAASHRPGHLLPHPHALAAAPVPAPHRWPHAGHGRARQRVLQEPGGAWRRRWTRARRPRCCRYPRARRPWRSRLQMSRRSRW